MTIQQYISTFEYPSRLNLRNLPVYELLEGLTYASIVSSNIPEKSDICTLCGWDTDQEVGCRSKAITK